MKEMSMGIDLLVWHKGPEHGHCYQTTKTESCFIAISTSSGNHLHLPCPLFSYLPFGLHDYLFLRTAVRIK